MTTKFGGELQQPITGITFGCEKILNFGYSSLKSREILGVHSLKAKTLAAISLPCHLPVEKTNCQKKKNSNYFSFFKFFKRTYPAMFRLMVSVQFWYANITH